MSLLVVHRALKWTMIDGGTARVKLDEALCVPNLVPRSRSFEEPGIFEEVSSSKLCRGRIVKGVTDRGGEEKVVCSAERTVRADRT